MLSNQRIYLFLKELDVAGVIELFHSDFRLENYDDILKENEINSSVLLGLTGEDLEEAGMKNMHSKAIVRNVARSATELE
jgi:hypothetical protein